MSGAAEDPMSALAAVAGLEPLVTALEGTVLDPLRPQYRASGGRSYDHDPELFTRGSAPRPLTAVAGRGATLRLSDGSELVDLCSMTENTVLGLNDPWVKLRQVSHVLSRRPHYVTVRFGNDLYYRVADRLSRHFNETGGGRDYVLNMRECTGSGAVELGLHAAWTAARAFPGRRRLASFAGAFHGSNLGGVLAGDHQPERGSGRVLLDHAPNVERFPVPEAGPDGRLSAATLEALATLERDGEQYFAVILEPIPWRNAVHVIPVEFLRRLREICTARSICLIFDEVQSGFGFTGALWYAEVAGVHPDISVLGKGLTSGHGTLSMIVADRAFGTVESPFGFKSNSANMLSLVAVDAVLDRLLGVEASDAQSLPDRLPAGMEHDLREGLLSTTYVHAVRMIDEMLTELCDRFPAMAGRRRGLGLMRGVVMLGGDGLPSSALAGEVARVCTEHGVHVRQAGTALFLKPCLVITRTEVDRALAALARTLETVAGSRAR
ncbi:aminotransferase class III-fold pyridoxal phosphate-dependent enzyme [Streptomyces naphthomycinicus]|uniref:aminotransferase class III-fold pyridoxal phosphate-dependent enzyme n=1 Tax=Streptomyces naphthomycinicus TaxID=2872625 RepID=UPI001CECA40D|nr:aminotransferase class III-fold pyridoxal phosphate-dependent enzyme [Streptomyces sp. TML10]